ncbi:hypothetical protein [Enterococcus faecalis]|uniref:hypothetical protein n=1 Tax=Enterococcus faecalis TaxID=1351 RepID=UPI00338F5A6B
MGQYELRKEGLELLKKIDTHRDNYIIIHYACESFKKGQTITAIAVRQFRDGQTQSFSLNKTAQILNIEPENISSNMKKIETKMLDEFFKYVEHHETFHWIHWNMSSDNFGFKGLEHRYRVLQGTPVIIDDSKKINLPHLFIELYDKGFAAHPRLENLMEMNHILPKDFYPGYSDDPNITDETDLLDEGRYKEIQISCLRKVDVFSNFLNLAIDDNLIVKTPKTKRYGLTIKGRLVALSEFIWFKPVSYFLTFVIGYFIEKLLDSFF